jgi:hypothetical protein
MQDVVTWAAIGAVSSAVVAVIGGAVTITLQISRGFAEMKSSFYLALQLHQKEDGDKFEHIGLRLQRLEINAHINGK